ncbi:unnamed protein product [Vitrella brassicaformis CCMP3155]|uniref:Calcineurin-like phosphoesterase domain-containing protein n=3 Tax=Vitrella brassicaformis TaxID=1169539 RepID=A0A0G4G490_VITBC|nr:unnamed protein product [Vitrella brassicaformis CCMP3155]|eukprot:CEM23230.1 unnamed protein product [Vitrella brassicaformis CCMP3155]
MCVSLFPASPRSSGVFREIMRIFAISDVHTDYRANLEYVQGLSQTAYKEDAVIVAGDVSDRLATLRTTLQLFTEKFGHGNHDVWVTRDEVFHSPSPSRNPTHTRSSGNGSSSGSSSNPKFADSAAKLQYIFTMCDEMGIVTTPKRLAWQRQWTENTPPAPPPSDRSSNPSEGTIWVVPLLSWYHTDFDTEPDIPNLPLPPVEQVITDFATCRWPDGLSAADGSRALAEYFDQMNDRRLNGSGKRNIRSWDDIDVSVEQVISFSHFLPRLDLLPEKRFLFYPNLPKAVGSDLLGQRVARLRPDMHVFGHTHFGWDTQINGTRFLQLALSYPYERQRRLGSIEVGPFPQRLMAIWEDGAFAPQQTAHWSLYYRTHKRDPSNTELAPWVKSRLEKHLQPEE